MTLTDYFLENEKFIRGMFFGFLNGLIVGVILNATDQNNPRNSELKVKCWGDPTYCDCTVSGDYPNPEICAEILGELSRYGDIKYAD